MPNPNLEGIRMVLADHELDAVVAFDHWTMSHLSGHMNAIPIAPGERFVLVATAEASGAVYCCWDFEAERIERNSWIPDIRPNPSWLELLHVDEVLGGDSRPREKPVQLEAGFAMRELAGSVRERGLARGRLGVEFACLSAEQERRVRVALPQAELVDASKLLVELRVVKTPEEVELLRRACRYADAGIQSLLRVGGKLRGKTAAEMRILYVKGVMEASLEDPEGFGLDGAHIGVSCGGVVSPARGYHLEIVGDNDILWWDYGASVHGYYSDGGRTCIVGRPHPLAERIGNALAAGLEAALEAVRPGVQISAVFDSGIAAVRRNGFPGYSRGHIGHGIGIGSGEWPPFVAPNEDCILEPGMTLAVEVPFYVRGLGGFQFENDIVVTDAGYESLTSFPRALLSVE